MPRTGSSSARGPTDATEEGEKRGSRLARVRTKRASGAMSIGRDLSGKACHSQFIRPKPSDTSTKAVSTGIPSLLSETLCHLSVESGDAQPGPTCLDCTTPRAICHGRLTCHGSQTGTRLVSRGRHVPLYCRLRRRRLQLHKRVVSGPVVQERSWNCGRTFDTSLRVDTL